MPTVPGRVATRPTGRHGTEGRSEACGAARAGGGVRRGALHHSGPVRGRRRIGGAVDAAETGSGEAVLLGLVQGLTEFLPVSSSGHLVIAETLLGGADESLVFEIAVHVGTLGAILLFYRARLAALLRGGVRGEADAWRYAGKIALATLPAVAVGLGLRDQVQGLFARPEATGAALLVTGAILWSTRRTVTTAALPEPGWAQAFAIGVAQALAVVPGISRSGTTVAAALALGVAPLAATEFSFLMAIPAITGAAVLALPDVRAASPEMVRACLVGGAVALVSGVGALWLFVRVLRRQRFHRFALYTWAAGGAFLVWLALGR